jgi:sulfide dehydrogenase cytochrome subunit
MRTWIRIALAATFAAAGGATAARAQAVAPPGTDQRLLGLTCSGCHGPGGRSSGDIPALYGRSAESIAETLRAFRNGTRPATVMGRLSKGYAEDELDAVARELAATWK